MGKIKPKRYMYLVIMSGLFIAIAFLSLGLMCTLNEEYLKHIMAAAFAVSSWIGIVLLCLYSWKTKKYN